jgi:type 1 glutamine amidotransferase
MKIIILLLAFLATQCWAAERPKIVFISGEYEYHSKETLPQYAKDLERQFDVQTTFLARPEDEKKHTIPGLNALKDADLVVLYVRRMTLPEEELAQVKKYLEAGRPLVALRTSSHAFENWKEFDREVLGGNYKNHYGNKLKTSVSIVPAAKESPLLRGVSPFVSDGSLYKNTPLQPGAKPFLVGEVEGHPAEPVAWTHGFKGGRILYTSLGHPNDFKEESFRNLLRNGIEWALQQPLQAKGK